MITLPCVIMRATCGSTDETASGIASKADHIDIDILHRGNTPQRYKLRLSAHTFNEGLMVLTLRRVDQPGASAVVARLELGEAGRGEVKLSAEDLAQAFKAAGGKVQ